MVKIQVLNNDEYENLANIENFSGHAASSPNIVLPKVNDLSCRDSQVRPLRYKSKLNDVKLKRMIIKIFNLIDSKKTGFIVLGDIKLDVDQLFNIVKKNKMMDNIKKSFDYMTHDMEHVKLDQVKNYLKIEKQIPDKILNNMIPKEKIDDEIEFYEFFSMIINASYLKLL